MIDKVTERGQICKLLQGDCLQLLKKIPNQSIDLILTDPPYNIARDNNFTTMGRAGIDFGEWDKNADIISWLNEIPRILSPNGSVIIFNAWANLGDIARHLEALGLVCKDMLRWIKTNPMPRNRDRRYITDYECAVWLVNKNAKWIFNRQDKNYQRPEFNYSVVSGKEKTAHPTQKPIKLMEELLKIHSNQEQLILDPFMGSGTTGIACLNLNRNFIGIELDPTYYNIAKTRIKNHSQN